MLRATHADHTGLIHLAAARRAESSGRSALVWQYYTRQTEQVKRAQCLFTAAFGTDSSV